MTKIRNLWEGMLDPNRRARLALVLGFLGSLVAGLWIVYERYSSKSESSVVQGWAIQGFVAEGQVNVLGDIQVGFTLEELDATLRRRKSEIQKEIETGDVQQAELQVQLTAEMQALHKKLANISQEYESVKARVAELDRAMKALSSNLSKTLIRDARKALLAKGDTRLAKELFQLALEKRVTESAEAARQLGIIAEIEGKILKAKDYYETAVELSPSTPVYLQNVGRVYADLQLYGKAEQYLQESIDLYETVFGSDTPYLVPALSELARAYHEQERYEEALNLIDRSSEILENTLGDDHSYISDMLITKATLLESQGNSAAAEDLYKRSLRYLRRIEEKVGTPSLSHGLVLNSLGALYQDQGRYTEAEEKLQQALTIAEKFEEAFEREFSLRIRTLNNLGILYMEQDRMIEAKKRFVKSLDLYDAMRSPDEELAALSHKNLGTLYEIELCHESAEEEYRQALELERNLYAPTSSRIIQTTKALSRLYGKQRRHSEGLSLLKNLLSEIGNHHGRKSLKTAEILAAVGEMTFSYAKRINRRKLGELLNRIESGYKPTDSELKPPAEVKDLLHEVENYYSQSVEISQQELDVKDPKVAERLISLAMLYRYQERLQESEKTLERAAAILESADTQYAVKLADVFADLAVLSVHQDQLEQADNYIKKSRNIFEKSYGAESLEVAFLLYKLAVSFQVTEQNTKADLYYRDSLEILEYRSRFSTREAREFSIILKSYAILLDELDQNEVAKKLKFRAESMREVMRARRSILCAANDD